MSSPAPPSNDHPIFRLQAVMEQLRDPVTGCPWDTQQTFATIAPYTVEEAYEVADAIERGDMADLKDELGDLLLQVVFHSRMAQEAGEFDFAAVATAISDKMVRRHPYVFAGAARSDHSDPETGWEAIKAQERAAKGRPVETHGVLDDVPPSLPALIRAVKLTKRAARVGFDWPSANEVLAKLREEVAELEVEIEAGDRDKAREELGDILFVIANLARKLEVEPEAALRGANAKFARRFAHIEARLSEQGRTPEESSLEEMDGLWNEAKRRERQP